MLGGACSGKVEDAARGQIISRDRPATARARAAWTLTRSVTARHPRAPVPFIGHIYNQPEGYCAEPRIQRPGRPWSSWGETKESAGRTLCARMVSATYPLGCARGGAVGNVAVGGSLDSGVELGVGRVHARQETLHRELVEGLSGRHSLW